MLRSYLPGFPAFQTGECAGSSYCNKKRTLVKAFFQLVDKVTKKWLDRQAFFVKMCVESNFWRFYHVDQTL
ncbi:hypothetical protein B4089_2373 [Bacillus licheniformis]|nr:hypothetical protein B4089_2373 [Bacillus licheniformis]